jgi:TPP-dependent pyruvate/acetoin dehydrogenase alpha subunit
MPCVQVDGNDIELAYVEVARAVDSIRGRQRPHFLEFKTWRWQGFSGEFRPAEEVRYWKEEKDPIRLARQKIRRAEQLAGCRASTASRPRWRSRFEDGSTSPKTAPCPTRPRRRRMSM